MHFWIALFLGVLGRRRSRDDRGIDDATGRDAQASAGQIMVHRVQDLAAQFVLLQQATEAKNRGLVGGCGTAQINARKTAQHRRLVESILAARIGEIKPLLQKVDAQHDRQPNRPTAVARLRVVRLDQRFQLTPRNHNSHHVQKLFTTALPCVLLKTCLACQSHLSHRVPHPHSTLSNLNAGRELKQRLLSHEPWAHRKYLT
jgi:hypothetical protein